MDKMPTIAISQRGTVPKLYLTAVNNSSVEIRTKTVNNSTSSVEIQEKAGAGEDFEENQVWSKEVMDEGGSGDQSFLLVSGSKPGGLVLFTDESKPNFVGLRERKLNRDGSKTTSKAKEEELSRAKKEELWMESEVVCVKAANNKSFFYIHKPGGVLDAEVDKSVVLSDKRDAVNPKPSQCWEYIQASESEGNAATGAYSGASSMERNERSSGHRSAMTYTATPARGSSGSGSGH